MPQLKVQNQYRGLITSTIAASGDVSFTVSVAPTYTNGFIVVSPDLSTQREVMYFHDVIGSTIYVKGVNRTSPKAHSSSEAIQINDVAEIFNTYSDMISQAFYVEKTGGLNIKVWGGYVLYNGNQVVVADTNLTLADNTTNYIKYTFNTNTISADTSNTGNIKAVVTTLSGIITSIVYRFSKESLIDFTVALTGALPDQSGNAGKSLITDGTNVSWQSPLPSQASNAGKNLQTDGTTTSWQAPAIASTTVSGVVEIATQAEFDVGTDVGSTGANLSVPPSIINNQLLSSYIAGEALTANDFVLLEIQRGFAFNANIGLASSSSIGDASARTRESIDIIGNGISASTMKMSLAKVGAPADSMTIRIETDTAGNPSGTLANANATATVTGASLTTTLADTTITFAGAFTLTDGVIYHIVISRVTAVDAVNYYIIGGYTRNMRGFKTNLYNGTVWGTAGGTSMIYISYIGTYSALLVKTSATNADQTNFIGCVNTTTARGITAKVQKKRIRKTFSGLTPYVYYYLSNTAGLISTTAGTTPIVVGISESTTELDIKTDPKIISYSLEAGGAGGTSRIYEMQGTIGYVILSAGNGGSTGNALLQFSPDGITFNSVKNTNAPTPATVTSYTVLSPLGYYRIVLSGSVASYYITY